MARVYPRGYRIIEWDSGRVLLPVVEWPLTLQTLWKVYDPFSKPALFGAFLRTPASEAGILQFAAKYGQIYSRSDQVWITPPGDPDSSPAEPVDLWARELLAMKRVWHVWECLNGVNRKGLPEFRPGPGQTVELVWNPPVGSLEVELEPGLAGLDDSPEATARRFLREEVNRRLSPLQASLSEDLTLTHRAKCVRDAMWYQLATAIAGGQQFGVCQHCGNWFALDPRKGGSRRSRKYCNDSCKSSAWQKAHPKQKEDRA